MIPFWGQACRTTHASGSNDRSKEIEFEREFLTGHCQETFALGPFDSDQEEIDNRGDHVVRRQRRRRLSLRLMATSCSVPIFWGAFCGPFRIDSGRRLAASDAHASPGGIRPKWRSPLPAWRGRPSHEEPPLRWLRHRVTQQSASASNVMANALHVFMVAADGTLMEVPSSPTILPVSNLVRPQGVAAL